MDSLSMSNSNQTKENDLKVNFLKNFNDIFIRKPKSKVHLILVTIIQKPKIHKTKKCEPKPYKNNPYCIMFYFSNY